MRQLLLGASLVALALGAAVDAHAHGRFPAATSVAVSRDGALAVGTTFGLLTRGAEQDAWSFVCQAALGMEEGTELNVSFENGTLRVWSADVLASSSDLGCSWSFSMERPPQPAAPRVAAPEVFATQLLTELSTEPAVTLVRARTRYGDRLLRSDDGGDSYHLVQQLSGALLAFAAPAEAGLLFWGGERDGLWSSPDLGDTLTQLDATREVTCLQSAAGALLLCDQRPTAPFQVGRSRDQGQSFEPLLHFAELTGAPPCQAPSYLELCRQGWLHELPSLLVFRAARAPQEQPSPAPQTTDAAPPEDEQPAVTPTPQPAPAARPTPHCSPARGLAARLPWWAVLAAGGLVLRRIRRPD